MGVFSSWDAIDRNSSRALTASWSRPTSDTSVATTHTRGSRSTSIGLAESRTDASAPSRRWSESSRRAAAPAARARRSRSAGPCSGRTWPASGVPMTSSTPRPRSSAKDRLQYRTVPSAATVAAPSRIASTSTRYECSAPCSV